MDSYLNLHPQPQPLKLLDKPCSFASSLAKANLAHQMRFSVQALEQELAASGQARVLQIGINQETGPDQGRWSLYANGQQVAGGTCSFARECFQQNERAFLNTCREAVELSSQSLGKDEFRLLSLTRDIAAAQVRCCEAS